MKRYDLLPITIKQRPVADVNIARLIGDKPALRVLAAEPTLALLELGLVRHEFEWELFIVLPADTRFGNPFEFWLVVTDLAVSPEEHTFIFTVPGLEGWQEYGTRCNCDQIVFTLWHEAAEKAYRDGLRKDMIERERRVKETG